MATLDVEPKLKMTFHTTNSYPTSASDDDDQNQLLGVAGNAVVSIDGLVVRSSTMLLISFLFGSRQSE